MASLSHIPASELAFENGNRKFLLSEIINISDKKTVIFDGVFSQEDGIFDILSICNTPHDFLRGFQSGPILEGGIQCPPPTRSSRKLGPQE